MSLYRGLYRDFGSAVVRASACSFTAEIVASILATDRRVKSRQNALPKVVGFLRVLPFPPTRKVDRVGQDKHCS